MIFYVEIYLLVFQICHILCSKTIRPQIRDSSGAGGGLLWLNKMSEGNRFRESYCSNAYNIKIRLSYTIIFNIYMRSKNGYMN